MAKNPATTVAAKSTPESEPDSSFRHQFVLMARDYQAEQDHEAMHEANKAYLSTEARNRGLAVTGPVELESAEARADGSVVLTYAVPAVPAVILVEQSDPTDGPDFGKAPH
jgi:hypothetical protein